MQLRFSYTLTKRASTVNANSRKSREPYATERVNIENLLNLLNVIYRISKCKVIVNIFLLWKELTDFNCKHVFLLKDVNNFKTRKS